MTYFLSSFTLFIPSYKPAQADMEEAHATGAAQAGVAASAAERGATGCASCLEEAWHWGFELDCWRAHLGPLTWPEILRQWATAAGETPTDPLQHKQEERLRLATVQYVLSGMLFQPGSQRTRLHLNGRYLSGGHP